MPRSHRPPLADDTRPRPGTTHTGCTCRNHLGRPKQQHKSKQAALDAILRQHLRHGGTFEAYRCPSSDRWHVRTVRR